MALRGRPLGEHFVNDLVWELLAGVLWVAGAIADGDARLVLWALAVLATYVGGWAQHWLPGRGRRVDLRHAEVSSEHLVERFRLFFIIALGETVLTTGAAFTGEPFELERLLAPAIGFTGTVVTSPLTLIVGIAASTAVLVAVAIADTMSEGDRAPSMSG